MHEVSKKEKAIQLRKEGYSYPYISKETGLSKSTLSGWLTSVSYKPNKETITAFGKARSAATKRKAEIRRDAFHAISRQAMKDVGRISRRDLFMFGLGLYLGEGTKTHNIITVANADPRVIQAVIAWFKGIGIENYQFSPRLHLYPDSNVEKSLMFWSKTLVIPQIQFQKTYLDIRSDKKYKKRGKLPHGTLYLSIRSRGRKEHGVELFQKIQAWNEALLRRVNKRD